MDRGQQEQQGLGMGLPLARKVIEAHGGKLEISSTEGEGTKIFIRLPLWDEKENQ